MMSIYLIPTISVSTHVGENAFNSYIPGSFHLFLINVQMTSIYFGLNGSALARAAHHPNAVQAHEL